MNRIVIKFKYLSSKQNTTKQEEKCQNELSSSGTGAQMTDEAFTTGLKYLTTTAALLL